MSTPTYSRTAVKARIATMVSGIVSDSDQNVLLNRAVTDVLSDVDLRTAKRKSALTPNLFDLVYQYACPTDMKGQKIIDVQPQIGRGRFDDWRLTVAEEFDRFKQDMRLDRAGDPVKLGKNSWSGDNIVAFQDNDFRRKILISKPVEDSAVTLNAMDSLGSWVLFGDGTNVVLDSSNFVIGSSSIKYDLSAAGGTTAGIQNSSVSSFDLTDYLMEGSIFVWAYVTSATNLTNFKLRIGSDSSNYNTMTVTTTNEGIGFYAGWQLLRFDLSGLSATGSPTNTACTFIALYMTKSALKISEVSYRFDNIVLRKGAHYDVVYYSKYGWQTSANVYLENSTDDTDLLCADTDDLNIIELRYTYLAEKHLRNAAAAKDALGEYMEKSEAYQRRNPSEAILITNTYFNIR